MPRSFILAEAQSVTTSGLDGDPIEILQSPSQVGGAPQAGTGFLYLAVTKTAGGTIDATTETIKLMATNDAGSTWFDVFQSHEDTDPVNFLTGVDGQTAFARAFPIRIFPVMKVVIDGDGATDTYDIDADIVIQTV